MRLLYFFFFNDTATTEIYTLPLHAALPICGGAGSPAGCSPPRRGCRWQTVPGFGKSPAAPLHPRDRKSTRLNSSHSQISYAVFCLKKKKTQSTATTAFLTTVCQALRYRITA